jgi:RNA polymerase sigma-70 factor (ECF subfamily)
MSTTSEKLRNRAAESLQDQSDEELLLRYRDEHDRAAFERLVERYEKELFSYLRRYLGDPSMAEDVFQATFLQVHLKGEQFEADKKFRPWLYTIATNQAIDAQRRNKRHRMVSLDRQNSRDDNAEVGSLVELLVNQQAGPVAEMETVERREWIRSAVADLPDPLRVAVMLIYYQGLKYREAADILKIPVGTVKSRLHTAVLKLNEAWNRTQMSGD